MGTIGMNIRPHSREDIRHDAIAARSSEAEGVDRGRVDLTRQRFAQQRAGPESARAHRLRRNIEAFGGVLDRHLLDLAQNECCAELLGQRIDLTFQQPP